ncbi:MAG TPA: hypothetical protein VIE63_15640 [Ramlibacter sp.]|jgi:hypothetical protein
MNNPAKSQEQTDLEFQNQAQREQEIYSLMRESGRSRVQVLNAIKVRGPDRQAVLRALGLR